MKKLLSILLTALLAVCCLSAFAACDLNDLLGGKNSGDSKQSIVGEYKLYSIIDGSEVLNLGDKFQGDTITEDLYTYKINDDNTFSATYRNLDRQQTAQGTYSEWHGHYIFSAEKGSTAVGEVNGNYISFIADGLIMNVRNTANSDESNTDNTASEQKFIGAYELFSIKETVIETGDITVYGLGDDFHDISLEKDTFTLNINSDKTFEYISDTVGEGSYTIEGDWFIFPSGVVLCYKQYWSYSTMLCSFDGDRLLVYQIVDKSPYIHEATFTGK